jgi:signal transduction histidine kinase
VAWRDRMLKLARATHLPRRTVRLRLTALYGMLFLLSGAALLTTTYFLVDAATGNAFIVHGSDGLTFAGYQIGSNPPGSKGGDLSLFSGGLRHTTVPGPTGAPGSAGSFKSNGAVGTRQKTASSSGFVTAGAASSGGKLTQAQTKKQQEQMANMQRQLETLAHAYQGSELHQLLIESGVALGIMVLLSGALGWVVAGRVLRPLRTITASTRDISASNLHERLAVSGPDDELKELGDTIDGLLERLEGSFRSQRQFVANASHELRTPLARQRTLAQVALADPGATTESLRAAHERILASGEQQEQLIDALLTLSRSQAGTAVLQPVDLAMVVDESVRARRPEAAVRQVTVTTNLRPATLHGDPRLVERLVANLLDNAVRHNVPGGAVTVRTGTRDDGAWLTLANDGPVVRASEIERLYSPFERLDGERMAGGEGFGLGLCVVRAVATAHGATVHTEARPRGGLRTEVWFPAGDGAAVTTDAASGAAVAVAAGGGPAGAGGRPGAEALAPVHALASDH